MSFEFGCPRSIARKRLDRHALPPLFEGNRCTSGQPYQFIPISHRREDAEKCSKAITLSYSVVH